MTNKWRVKLSGEHWIAYAPDARMFPFPGDRNGWRNALALASMEASYELMEPTA